MQQASSKSAPYMVSIVYAVFLQKLDIFTKLSSVSSTRPITSLLITTVGYLFENTQKVCKNQVVTAGCLLTVLDMRPSTTNNPTSNNDPKFTASPNSTLVWDHTRSQTNLSRSQTSPDSRWHQYGLVAYPSYLTGSSCINYDPK